MLPQYDEFIARAGRAEANLLARGLEGLSAAETILRVSRRRPVFVVTPTASRADDLMLDLRFLVAADEAAKIWRLPSDDKTPYHKSSPDRLIVMDRSATLFEIASGAPLNIVVAPVAAFLRRQVPTASWQRHAELLGPELNLDRDAFGERLVNVGYTQVNTVEDRGTFAIRGSIVDVYDRRVGQPIRIDLFGDIIESIRFFDPQTQRAGEHVEEVTIGPAKELHLDEKTRTRGVEHLRALADQVNFPTKKLRALTDDLKHGIPFFGLESLMPALHPPLESAWEMLKQSHPQAVLIVDDASAVASAANNVRQDYDVQYEANRAQGVLCYPPSAFLIDEDEPDSDLSAPSHIHLGGVVATERKVTSEFKATSSSSIRRDMVGMKIGTDKSQQSLLAPLVTRIRSQHREGDIVVLPTQSAGGGERLRELLTPHGVALRNLKTPPDVLDKEAMAALRKNEVHAYTYVARPALPTHGGALAGSRTFVITEEDIFGKRARRGSAARKRKGFGTSLADLKEGDFVVHVEFGIGRYEGLVRLDLRGVEQDFVLLVYHGEDKLYLPVYRINLIQRYAGADGRTPRLDKLGGTGWQTTKKKVKRAVMAMAQELLNLYAIRELAQRDAFPPPGEAYMQFESAFPFEPTPDQQKAIDDVLSDMQSERPMDRLICGDVGYGKTEVGMRGAMICVSENKQVAVLAPTTVLAQQHYLTFTERFKDLPVTIEVISRFRTAKEVKDILTRAKEGRLDILIGTHRLLSNDVGFKDLGLVIVDEEQRFGVKSKEKLKKLRASVDLMTLSATPIPRTLQMGFFGVRDLSVIETPPVDRLAIRTQVIRFDDDMIREALMRELNRGGQVFFVHNRVRSIGAVADYLARLCPEARIGIGHGQMKEDQLEAVMLKFIQREINVLVCTAIIETGIDVPSANTMFIDHADDFGLAQLYQLRGRIGRSKDRAFAYLLIPRGQEHLTPDAQKRLSVLQRFSELGAGFKIAQHDLELRGAGDLLGKSQHGHVTAVGYDLYAELLKEAVEELRGKGDSEVPDPEVSLPVRAYIPEKFIADIQDRLSLYQRLATAEDGPALFDVVGEITDRYGDPPPELSTLADVMLLKQKLRRLGARALEVGAPVGQKGPVEEGADAPPRVVITVAEESKLDTTKVAALLAQQPDRFKLTKSQKLVVVPTTKEWADAVKQVVPVCRIVLDMIATEML